MVCVIFVWFLTKALFEEILWPKSQIWKFTKILAMGDAERKAK
jgi:hypothetical protein